MSMRLLKIGDARPIVNALKRGSDPTPFMTNVQRQRYENDPAGFTERIQQVANYLDDSPSEE